MLPDMAQARHAGRHAWLLPVLAVAVVLAAAVALVSLFRPTTTVTATAVSGPGAASAAGSSPGGAASSGSGPASAGAASRTAPEASAPASTDLPATGAPEGSAAACSAPLVPRRTVVPGPDRVAVNVHAAGASEAMTRQAGVVLGERGFVIGELGGNPGGTRVSGAGQIRHGEQGLAGALLVQAYVPGAVLVAVDRPDAVVDLELGAGFTGVASAAAVERAMAAGVPEPGACADGR